MSEIKNLWSKEMLTNNNLVLPITILHEQARYLNEMAQNIIVAKVNTSKVTIAQKNNESKPGILHILKIVAPAIGNYDFDLVRLIQEQLLPYPLTVYSPLLDMKVEVVNSDQLQIALSTIFNDKKTISTIQSLLLQSK